MSKKTKKTGGSMKKRSIFNHRSIIKASVFVLILMIAGQLQAVNQYHNTEITSSETWQSWDDEENEPITHIVGSGASVAVGATLTIQDSCMVDIQAEYGFPIYGGLTSNGNNSSPITFSGSQLKLINAAGSCNICYSHFYGCDLVVDNCDNTVDVNLSNFSNGADVHIKNGSNPYIGSGEFIEGADIYVSTYSNPLIRYITGVSIYVSGGSAPTVEHCSFNNGTFASTFNDCGSAIISDCSFNDHSFNGIEIYGAGNGLEFVDCTFNNNADNGIEIAGTGTTTFTDCSVENNGTNGVYATGGNFTFTNLVIEVPVGNKPMDLFNANMTIKVTDLSGTVSYGLEYSDFSGCNVTLYDCTFAFSLTNCNFSNGSDLIIDNSGILSEPYIWNCVFDNAGITVDNVSGPNIKCEFTNGSSITVDNDSTAEIHDCEFTGGSSINVDNGSNPNINQCNFTGGGITVNNNSDPSIVVINGGWIHVSNNSTPNIDNVTGSYIKVESGSAPIVEYCTFDSTSIGGRFYGCGHAVFTCCTFEDNTDGIHINVADSLEFRDCYFKNNLIDGIKVEGTGTTFFTSCEVENNGYDGIDATGGNLIFTNSLIYNNGSCGMCLPAGNMTMTITDSLRIVSNGSAAIEIHPNVVGRLPADSLFSLSGNNPNRICVTEGTVTQNATWLKRNNPYIIYGNIFIEDTAVLQLSANCDLEFDYSTGIEINGAIVADSVNFKQILYGSWKGLLFKYNIPGSVLNACNFENAGFRDEQSYAEPASIIIYDGDVDSTVTMIGCNINNGNGHGIFINRNASPYIDDCTINNCSGNGIYISRSSDPIITNSTITSSDSCGIYINYSSEPYIDNCNISNNGTYGIFTKVNNNAGTLKNGSIQNNI